MELKFKLNYLISDFVCCSWASRVNQIGAVKALSRVARLRFLSLTVLSELPAMSLPRVRLPEDNVAAFGRVQFPHDSTTIPSCKTCSLPACSNGAKKTMHKGGNSLKVYSILDSFILFPLCIVYRRHPSTFTHQDEQLMAPQLLSATPMIILVPW